MRTRTWAAVVVVGLLGVGCRSQCRQLSERLCECATNTVDRDACLRRAAAAEGAFPPTAEDEATCAPLVEQCDCRLIDTGEGKARCGQAYAGPVGVDGGP